MLSRKTLPVILQTEMTECGLACMAMIARYHGHDIDLNVLRRRHLVSMSGSSLGSLMKIAGTLDLSPRPLRVELDQLEKVQMPAIIHWDLNHYVVLKQVKGDKVTIIDPGVGQRVLTRAKVSKHFTGVAMELSPTAEFDAQNDRLRPHLSLLWSNVLRALSEAVRGWAILVYGNQMSLQMVGNVFSHLIRLPTRYFEKRHVGDIISRMSSTKPIQEALTQSVVSVLIDGVMAILMLAVMFLYSPLLAGIVLISAVLLIIATLIIYPHLRRTQEEAIYAKAIENTHVIESIRANTTVKLFGRESEREAAWRNLYSDFINASVDYGKYLILQKFAETLINGLQIVIVVWAAATLMMDGGALTSGGGFTKN